ncbi:Hydroxymethylpyrimidine ABC transporter, substrate-binding component [Minicystis rosea]|nr:Hydroxymethylpyrimidine ABC transporter, substrate-binding component [Minicystis rosea]
MITRRSLLAALALSTLAGCDKPAGPAPQGSAASTATTAVKLQLDWVPEPEFGGFYAAREIGAFRKEGLDVDIQGGGAGVPVVQMVATGKVDFGIAGADEVITARARGADVVPIFAVYQKSPQAIMTHAARGAKTLADVLASGSLAIEPGLSYAAFLRKKFGFDKVKVVPYDGGIARFLTDKDFAQQCFITSEPIAARKKGADPKVFLVADEGFNPYLGVIIARSDLVKDKPDMVKAFVRASRAGWQSYLADPAPANAVMGKLNKAMDTETFTAAAAAQKPLIEEGGKIGAMTKERWQTLGKQLVDLGLIEKANVPEVPNLD